MTDFIVFIGVIAVALISAYAIAKNRNVYLGLRIKQWAGNLTIGKRTDNKKKLQTVVRVTRNVLTVNNQLEPIVYQIIKDINVLKNHLENRITNLFI
jgi:hypothetical protein